MPALRNLRRNYFGVHSVIRSEWQFYGFKLDAKINLGRAVNLDRNLNRGIGFNLGRRRS
jgi:hypothetical protein